MSYLAPAGTPISATDLWHWLRRLPRSTEELARFQELLTEHFQLLGCEFLSSGRTAMTLLLETLYQLRGEAQRTEVIIPGYTCYSVPASVKRAGFQVRICDVNPATLSYDLSRLAAFDFSRVLAVVSANLYGIPDDLLAIEALAKRHRVFMVDDAAQGLGASFAGRAVGTFGDAGLFSLDKGKNITSIQGGILVTRSGEIAAALRQRVASLPLPATRDTVTQIIKLLVYAALLPPSRYGITRRLPFLGLGRTPFETYSPLTSYSPSLGLIASTLYNRLGILTSQRRSNAHRVLEAIEEIDGLTPIEQPASAESVYVRLPLLTRNRETRDAIISALEAAGIGASASYPTAVVDIYELRQRLLPQDFDCPGSRRVAATIVTLPTHPFVTAAHIQRMVSILHREHTRYPAQARPVC